MIEYLNHWSSYIGIVMIIACFIILPYKMPVYRGLTPFAKDDQKPSIVQRLIFRKKHSGVMFCKEAGIKLQFNLNDDQYKELTYAIANGFTIDAYAEKKVFRRMAAHMVVLSMAGLVAKYKAEHPAPEQQIPA